MSNAANTLKVLNINVIRYQNLPRTEYFTVTGELFSLIAKLQGRTDDGLKMTMLPDHEGRDDVFILAFDR